MTPGDTGGAVVVLPDANPLAKVPVSPGAEGAEVPVVPPPDVVTVPLPVVGVPVVPATVVPVPLVPGVVLPGVVPPGVVEGAPGPSCPG